MTTRFLLVLILGQLVVGCSNDNPAAKTDYTQLSGVSGDFSDHRGKWMVINYWATWCKPCIEEIPELNNFAEKHKDTVKLFAVDFDNARGDKLVASAEKMGIEFPILIDDPHSLLGFEKPYALPTTFVFNPQGKLQKTLLGPQTEESLLKALAMKD